jgi:hypothetical protein
MVVECSSISLDGSAELRALLAARGTQMLAAPVSGNAKVIKAGRLSSSAPGRGRFRCGAAVAEGDRAGRQLRRRGRARAHRQDLPQRLPRRRHPVAGRDHGARPEGRRAAARLPRVHEPERDGLDLLALQVAGPGEPRFQGHLHPQLLRKDLDLGLDAARHFGVPMPLASITRDLIQTLIGHGVDEEDFAKLIVLQARRPGSNWCRKTCRSTMA